MRQTASSGSVKAIWLDRAKAIEMIKAASLEAGSVFPEIKEIRLFGSLAKGEETGLSDIDLFILVDSQEKNPIERVRPYFLFFSEKLEAALDIIAATSDEMDNFRDITKKSVLFYKKRDVTAK